MLFNIILSNALIPSLVYSDDVMLSSNQKAKPIIEAVSIPEENYVKLSWEIDDNSQPYTFKVHQIKEGEDEAQSIPLKQDVRVLNIYPNIDTTIPNRTVSFTNWKGESFILPVSASLKKWMEEPNDENSKGYGMGLIDVTPVGQEEFNLNPNKYLKNEDGTWKYDVIFNGMADSNARNDFTQESVGLLKEFIASGRGFLVGHDTFGTNRTTVQLAEFANIKRFEEIGVDGGSAIGSDTIKIRKKGLLTNYPWLIGELGDELVIPPTHSTNLMTYGDVWIDFINLDQKYHNTWNTSEPISDNNGNGTNNFYLTTWNNTAMIQTGHVINSNFEYSTQDSTPDEQKILANTLFYLAQLSTETSWNDHSGQDLSAPKKPIVNNVSVDSSNQTIEIEFTEATDIGSTYGYYVEAIGGKDNISRYSDIVYTTITSGLKGYSIVVDKNPETIPDNVVDTTDTIYELNTPFRNNFYIHIGAIDNAGNMSVSHYYYNNETTSKINIIPNIVDWTNNEVTINVSAEDEFKVEGIQLPNGIWVNDDNIVYLVDKNGDYTFKAKNYLGNITEKTITITNIDKIPPTKPVVNRIDNKLVLTKATDNESGIDKHMYSLDDGEWAIWTNDIDISNLPDGNHIVKVKAIDKATNETETSFSFLTEYEAIKDTNKAIDDLNSLDESIIDGIQNAIDNIKNSETKNELQNKLNEKVKWLKEQEAIKAVEKARNTLSENDYNKAMKLVNELHESSVKDELMEALNQIKELMETKKEQDDIKDSIDNSIIDDDIDLDELDESLDELQDRIDNLPDGEEKSKLQDELNKLREQLKIESEKRLEEATRAVELAEATKREPYISRAKAKIAKLKDGLDKEALEDRIKAIEHVDQGSIDFKDAELAVKLAEATKREPYISRAKAKVRLLTSGSEKEQLEQRLYEIEKVLNQNNEAVLKNAERIVSLAEILKRESNLLSARDAINRLRPSEEKTSFLIRLEKVAKDIEGKELTDDDIAIIKATYYVELAETYDYEFMIRKAMEEVEKLPEGQHKQNLSNRLNNIAK